MSLTSYVLQEQQWYLALTTQLHEVGTLHTTQPQHVVLNQKKEIKQGETWCVRLTIVNHYHNQPPPPKMPLL
jgi:hypothetical protein